MLQFKLIAHQLRQAANEVDFADESATTGQNINGWRQHFASTQNALHTALNNVRLAEKSIVQLANMYEPGE